MRALRNDLFPKMITFMESKDKTIARYVDQAFEGISSMFSSKDEFIKYINSLNSRETAELFLKICKFHAITKKYQPTSYIKLIMILSAIERITSKDRPYIEFCFWITSDREKIRAELAKWDRIDERIFRKMIGKLREEYFTIYGSSRNVLDFFQNHLSDKSKLELIKSIRAKWTKVIPRFCFKTSGNLFPEIPQTIEEAGKWSSSEIRERLVPYCYDWRHCWLEVSCVPSISCSLLENPSLLNKILKKVVRDIYQMRNDFVHNAKIVALSEGGKVGVLSVVGKERKPISIVLSSKELERIFENGLKHYFDSFLG